MSVKMNIPEIKDWSKLQVIGNFIDDYDLTDHLMDYIEKYNSLIILKTSNNNEIIVMYINDNTSILFIPGQKVYKGNAQIYCGVINNLIYLDSDNIGRPNSCYHKLNRGNK